MEWKCIERACVREDVSMQRPGNQRKRKNHWGTVLPRSVLHPTNTLRTNDTVGTTHTHVGDHSPRGLPSTGTEAATTPDLFLPR
mmetsp:Transcript_27598/g.59031  ORF Transcript_27598/g.59031 Transcript_27598/m.59031 type:complete len:84 (+) Transcript_27598:333-584(+)